MILPRSYPVRLIHLLARILPAHHADSDVAQAAEEERKSPPPGLR